MTLTESSITTPTTADTGPGARIACAAGAALALVPFALCSFSGDTGAEITESLRENAVALQVGAGVSAVAGALLLVAAVRLAARVPGATGRVLAASGIAVAVLFVAYYAGFGAGAVVADVAVTDDGPGVGAATSVLVNFAELTRYAPGLALTAAAFVARRHLPRGVWIVGALLALLTIVPLTSWMAAIAIPLWLGVSGAAVRGRTK